MGVDYELSPQRTVSDVTNAAMRDFYEELEGVICCCMAAGVSYDKIAMTEPRMITNGYIVKIDCGISFEGLK